MTDRTAQLLCDVLGLSEAEREEFLYHLYQSEEEFAGAPFSSPSIAEAWRNEIARRVADYREGKAVTTFWEEVRQSMEAVGKKP